MLSSVSEMIAEGGNSDAGALKAKRALIPLWSLLVVAPSLLRGGCD